MPSTMVSSRSRSVSSVIVTLTFFVLLVSVGPNVTDFGAMLKSVPSVAVPPPRTSMPNVVAAPGRWLTDTGTSSEPPLSATFFANVWAISSAFLAKPISARSSSASSTVTVATAPVAAAYQPATAVGSVAVKVSSPSTRSSSASGIVSVAVVSPASTVTVCGAVPVSSAVAVLSPE